MLLIVSQECDDDGTFTVRYEDGETQDGNCRRHTPIDLALTLLQMEILHTVPQLRDFLTAIITIADGTGIPKSELRWVSGPSKAKAAGNPGALDIGNVVPFLWAVDCVTIGHPLAIVHGHRQAQA